MKESCFNCNFRGEIKPDRDIDRVRVYCLYCEQWRRDDYSCAYWMRYSHNLSEEDRSQIARNQKTKGYRSERYLGTVTYFNFVFAAIAIIVILLVILIRLFTQLQVVLWGNG